MVVDGKAIAEEIKANLKGEIAGLGRKPRLALVVVGEDFATSKFVKTKKRIAGEVGIEVVAKELAEEISEEELGGVVKGYADDESISGIVVQLPLPKHINTKAVLDDIPPLKDVDALTENSSMLSPVVLAIKEVLERGNVDVVGKKVLVVGRGKLVGIPAANWLKEVGALVTTADIDTDNLARSTKDAEIIVTGAGVAGLITSEMISDGVALLDAGTSETSGELRGDAKAECSTKCSIFTPVPGGIGPIAVTMLLKNVVTSAKKQ
ncbi:MAG: bifunctional 5,10-methylenetetrahydrofolate dehydrogenase/5,10-methenyltetrahydrofolate cyclohydrolase [Parcubacteria group bacterium]|nr:bifunctional 5,10-methylenetetrahydrofolate dehydrogenase/5,10-methenyltetrahydrofolate cyclohydrolase [Parcubacteria group bacterium]